MGRAGGYHTVYVLTCMELAFNCPVGDQTKCCMLAFSSTIGYGVGPTYFVLWLLSQGRWLIL